MNSSLLDAIESGSSPEPLSLLRETASKKRPPAETDRLRETAFGCPRDFLNNRFVYVVISPRARGLSIGVNMNPDKYCNYDCAYCEVNRGERSRETSLDVEVMAAELRQTLNLVRSGGMRGRAAYAELPEELLQLRHVALSGDGEPTLCPNFAEAVHAVVHIRALSGSPFFKLVLITNATGLDQPAVGESLKHFTTQDEIWVKLETGTQPYMDRVNRGQVPLEKVLLNILSLGRRRSVVVQSLFPSINNVGPSVEEIEQFAQRLRDLKAGGAQISLVQIYSATRPTPHSECGHLPLKTLAGIARRVRDVTGLRAEVF